MPRPGYMSEETQRVFDEFVKIKGIKKTEALSEMLRMYMLSCDEKLYIELEKKYLGIRNTANETASSNDYIFIKLTIGNSVNGAQLDGHGVIKAYQDNLNANGHGYTWFSTDSLRLGMSKAKADDYNSRIQSGEKVIMLFAVADEQNDICYTAEVLAVHTSKLPVDCPDGNTACVPAEFNGEDRARKIWIKLTNIKSETTLKADMFRIISTGANLKHVISSSQYHFGYVCLAEDDATKTEIPF